MFPVETNPETGEPLGADYMKERIRWEPVYEITQINNAIARNPAYIQLQSLEALKSISKDPASKMYFMDGSSPTPLPLMHLGDTQGAQR